jgi:cytochrome c peroxidase
MDSSVIINEAEQEVGMDNRRIRKAIAVTVLVLVPVRSAVADHRTDMELLGKFLFYQGISTPGSMSCAVCHGPDVGFTGPDAEINRHGTVYRGAVPERFGNRKPPSSAYATFSPVLHYDEKEGFVGGNFWDGRATGKHLGNPAADQAQGPFLNPLEQNNPDKKTVLEKVKASSYGPLWQKVWGEPLSLDTPQVIDLNYDRVGRAIATYEASSEMSPFSSKYDYHLRGLVQLSSQEQQGLTLFNGKGQCASCHTSTPGPKGQPPLFTDFTYANLGVPKNPENPYYRMDRVNADGKPINPEGADWVDLGLADFLRTSDDPAWRHEAPESRGKHKVPTLRNVDKRPSPDFPKAYMHNGVFKSLQEVVHFYNTRDVPGAGWPAPEVPQNVNTAEAGNLKLTPQEEAAIVAFLKALSDGYTP